MTSPASELKRRLVHASGAALPVLYLLGAISWRTLGYLFAVGSVVAGGLEAVRLLVGLDWRIYDELIRDYERENVAGYALYMGSMTGVALLAPPYAAVPGMLMLAIGDPISGVLGSNEAGRAKRAGVIVAMFAACLALALPVVLSRTDAVTTTAVAAASAGALAATLADGLTPVVWGYVVDDNLTIPPAAALGIWVALRLLG
ncbi:dolichol kinase [Haloplanus sp. GCM10025708]|uniref:dolichol kinase n=1 Tax=Haloferacaceae TaxID=1644056 RepID=UPI003606879C